MTDSISCTLTDTQMNALMDLPTDGEWLRKPGYRVRRIEFLMKTWPGCIERGLDTGAIGKYRLTPKAIEAKKIVLDLRDSREGKYAKLGQHDVAEVANIMREYLMKATRWHSAVAKEHAEELLKLLQERGFRIVRV